MFVISIKIYPQVKSTVKCFKFQFHFEKLLVICMTISAKTLHVGMQIFRTSKSHNCMQSQSYVFYSAYTNSLLSSLGNIYAKYTCHFNFCSFVGELFGSHSREETPV